MYFTVNEGTVCVHFGIVGTVCVLNIIDIRCVYFTV